MHPRNIRSSSILTVHRADGCATATLPNGGWQENDLANYFKKPYTAPTRSATRSLPSSSSGSKPNVGAIAGGVVGGVVALVVIAALAWFFLRRRRRQNQDTRTGSNLPPHATAQQHKSTATANEKYAVSPTTASYPSTYPSPHPQTIAYSPQASPPPPAWSERHTPST
jgi:hypothetical protein